MKTPIAVTLIIVGGLLIMAPIISDHLQRGQVAAALGKPGVASIQLNPTLSEAYRFGCWLSGTAMIIAAIALSRPSNPS